MPIKHDKGPSVNDVTREEVGGRGGVQVCITNNVEGCIQEHKGEGGIKMLQISMTSFMDDPKVV